MKCKSCFVLILPETMHRRTNIELFGSLEKKNDFDLITHDIR